MTTTLVNAESLLAFDIGAVTTRAILFDVVEGRYRFLGAGTAPTTAGAPYLDIREGIRTALDQLQLITGRTLVGADEQMIIPSKPDGSGVDACVAVVSAGPPLKIVAVGLLEDISAESAQNLASTTYSQVVDSLSLHDRRKTAARLDTLLGSRPDVVIVAGGVDGGASHSVMSVLEAVGLACYLLPKEQRPEVLFVGNQALSQEVQNVLGTLTSLHLAPNIRPALEIEQLGPAQNKLAATYRQARIRQIKGMYELDQWCSGRLLPAATAFGRTVRFISKEYARTNKGVLGVDLGASATTLAAAFAGELVLQVYPRLGLGAGLAELLQMCALEDITRWLPLDLPDEAVEDYIANKAIYPGSLPASAEALAIEQALARQVIRLAVEKTTKNFPAGLPTSRPGLLPWFEPIIASGSVLTYAPNRGQSLLMLLDALQPSGVTTIALDQNNLMAAVGAAANANPLLAVQSLDASNFLNLCTVISPIGNANPGTPVLRMKTAFADGSTSTIDVKYGSLEVVPLALGQSATLQLQPLHRFDVGMGGPGRSGSVKVMGGTLGVVVDARGRPLRLPADAGRRRDLLKKWLWTVGA